MAGDRKIKRRKVSFLAEKPGKKRRERVTFTAKTKRKKYRFNYEKLGIDTSRKKTRKKDRKGKK